MMNEKGTGDFLFTNNGKRHVELYFISVDNGDKFIARVDGRRSLEIFEAIENVIKYNYNSFYLDTDQAESLVVLCNSIISTYYNSLAIEDYEKYCELKRILDIATTTKNYLVNSDRSPNSDRVQTQYTIIQFTTKDNGKQLDSIAYIAWKCIADYISGSAFDKVSKQFVKTIYNEFGLCYNDVAYAYNLMSQGMEDKDKNREGS